MTTHPQSHLAEDHTQVVAHDAERYWRTTFSGEWPTPKVTFGPASALRLVDSTDSTSPQVELILDAEHSAAVARLAAARSVPSATVVLAAWYVLLQMQTEQEDLVIGVYGTDHPTLPVRLMIDPDTSFADHLEQVSTVLRGARHYRDYPFVALAQACGIDTLPGTDRLCNVIFADDVGDASKLDRIAPGADLLLAASEGMQRLQIRIIFNPNRFQAATIARYGRQLVTLLHRAASTPQQVIRELDALPDDERALILTRFNNTRTDYPRDMRIEHVLEMYAASQSDQLAVVHRSGTLTYQQLNSAADRLASVLASAIRRPDEPIALLMRRGPSMVIATLAVLKAGAAYLPIDPNYPGDRIAYMLADSGARLLLAGADSTLSLAQELVAAERFSGQVLALDSSGMVVESARIGDRDEAEQPRRTPPLTDPGGQLAYLMYTSGTTGRPKGVLITHRGVVRHVCGVEYVHLDPDTRTLQAGAIGFDMATTEMWGGLLNGGCLHIVDRDTLLDAAELGRFLADHQTSYAVLPTSLFAQLVEQDPTIFRPLRQALVGGEAMLPWIVRRVREACPNLRLVNGYGPTENTGVSTAHQVTERDDEVVPIGKPVENSTAYIFSRYGQLQPIGMPGELYVGGDGLGLGYLHRPDLTAQVFVPNPFAPGERLYRTGDRGRWLPDGSIEFLGRTDHQVKVRGFRIELQEIESQMMDQPGVRDAVVLVKRRPNGIDAYLCAYVCGDDDLDLEQLRASLKANLPTHMVPSYFVRLKALPLTANGKLDRAALPEPTLEDADEADQPHTSPRDPIERTIAAIWEATLDIPDPSINLSLHSLGASSLTATLLAAQIERALGVRCPVAHIFAAPTIAGIAAYVRQAQADGFRATTALVPAAAKPRYRLSSQQRRLYVEQIKDPASTQYNLPIVIELSPPVDVDRLRAALAELARRHEILRTAFVEVDGEGYQQVLPTVSVALRVVHRPLDDPDEIAAFVRPFDLSVAPAWRAALHYGSDRTWIMLDIHHILTDGFSMALLFREWMALYQQRELPAPALQYKDYAEWITSPEQAALLTAQQHFWLDVFTPLPAPLELPTDFPRPAIRTSDGAQLVFDLSPERTTSLRELARREQVTLYHVLLATYGIFLARISGQQDVTVGTPVSGRNIAGTEQIQGMFVNTICLRLRPEAGSSFRDYLRAVAAHALAAADHQEYPFDALVRSTVRERDYSRNPLFDTLFALQNTDIERIDFLGGTPQWLPEATGQTIFDLNLHVHDLPHTLRANWGYNRQLFRQPTVDSFRAIWLSIIDAVLDDPQLMLDTLLVEQRSTSAALPDIDFMF